MKLNEKGEVFTLTALALVGICSLLVGMTFSPIKKVFGFGTDGQKTKQSYVSKTESQPIAVKGQDGKTYWLQQTKEETKTSDEREEPKMSIGQKLLMLPRLWLLLMVLGIFFPPIAAIMAFVNNGLKNAAKQMVAGVENGMAAVSTKSPEAKQAMLDAMSKKYDSATKLLVNKIKAKL